MIGTGRSPEDTDLATRLEEIRRQIADDQAVAFDVGGTRVDVPTPASVTLETDDEGGETTLELRW